MQAISANAPSLDRGVLAALRQRLSHNKPEKAKEELQANARQAWSGLVDRFDAGGQQPAALQTYNSQGRLASGSLSSSLQNLINVPVPAPATTWNADPAGAYVAKVRAAIANPPPGTSNTAHDDLAVKYPKILRDLRSAGIGASTFGPEDVDDYASNSFGIRKYPEESLDDTSNHTYHKYGVLTYLGPVDKAAGVTKEWVVQNVLIDRYGYPARDLAPTKSSFTFPSTAYSVAPVLAPNPNNLANPGLYDYKIGVIEQVRTADGVVNLTTTDHTVYPGTTRRSVVEFDGGLYIYTTGSGINRYNNSGWGLIPFQSALTLARNTAQSSFAFGNDNFGPQAFRALDLQAVAYVNGVRAAAA